VWLYKVDNRVVEHRWEYHPALFHDRVAVRQHKIAQIANAQICIKDISIWTDSTAEWIDEQ